MTVDTACSSSMVSIFHACRALNSGDCRAAKAFDASADGYCRSEGCGVFILKRLSDAIDENDNILGVIKGVEINQSGNADSITHPHAPTQTQLFEKLFSKADIDPLRVSVVEAHGTGTQVSLNSPLDVKLQELIISRLEIPRRPKAYAAFYARTGMKQTRYI